MTTLSSTFLRCDMAAEQVASRSRHAKDDEIDGPVALRAPQAFGKAGLIKL